MKYTKLFNNHSEYVAYTANTEGFFVPNVSWCIQEEEPHCTPAHEQCSEEHEYALVGTPTYPQSIGANDASFEITFQYSDTYTARTCDTGVTYGEDYDYVTVGANPTTNVRTISGTYHSAEYGIDIPYTITQQGQQITVSDPVISCDGLEITITCATQDAEIYYQLDSTGGFSLYSTPIAITADTFVEAYSTLLTQTSTTVSETCEYTPTHDYSKDYLTFRVLTGGTIMWVARNNVAKTISYKVNDAESWTEITASSTGTPINVSAGDKVLLKGSNDQYATAKDAASCFSGGTAYYDVEGNIMSLIGSDNFSGLTSFNNKSWVFHDLFAQSKVVSAKNLILPVMTLTTCCYRALFSKANYLTEAPALPATTLAASAYTYMFDVTLITEAPELLAETVPASCYQGMFQNCSNLNYIKCMATSITASNSTSVWVQNVSPTGTFVKNSNMSSWTTGNNGIPTGWTVRDDGAIVEPTISFDGYDTIAITCETSGADIYYRLNQSGGYSAYTTAITITADTTVETYSEKDGETSTTVSQSCTYVQFNQFEYSNRSLNSWTYDNELTTVTVPYSVNAIDGHSSAYTTDGSGAKLPFSFETSVNLREAEPTYLWFEHADQSADIYVDNTLVETHWGGYNAFFSDISNHVHTGTNNIKVSLRNKIRSELAPCAGDFNFNATLGYVKLFTSPYLPDKEYGYDGFHITSQFEYSDTANTTASAATITVKTSIPTGATVNLIIKSGSTNIYSATSASTSEEMIFTTPSLTGSNLHLWDGTADPFLYDITLEIYHGQDLYHRYTRGYGLRYYDYLINDTTRYGTAQSPFTGFKLNGHDYLLRGVCMHSDKENKANALTSADIANDFNIITELGCNFLRLAHYPHPKEVYEYCDRLGIVVQTEVPWVNDSSSGKPESYYTHLTGQYDDMVKQHYNHPCIFFWGLANEITPSTVSFTKAKIEQYTTQIKALDSERMVGFVVPMSVSNPTQFDSPNVDWYGYNCYEGWYQNKNTNNPTSALNTRVNNTINNANKAMAFSEYGCGGTPVCHSDDFMTTTERGNYPRHDIEYHMWLHEGHIAAIKNFPQLMFTSQWQLFDIAVSSRQEGYVTCLDGENTSTDDNLKFLNDKGLVERDHVTKKDTFYLYKAWWNTADTFVHICGKNYQKIDDRVIKCCTNVTSGTSLTMYINGTSAATATVSNNIAEFAVRDFTSGDVVSVSGSNVGDSFTISGITNKHDYVEIAGTKWATTNIGATGVTDYGLYFQWGDTQGYTASQVGSGSGQKYFGWADYKFGNGTSSPGNTGMTKYNSTDGKTVLEAADDAAQANWGNGWRMPTAAELQALGNAVNTAWTSDYQSSGVSGLVCTDKTDSSKVLFFPAAGRCYDGNFKDGNSHSTFWTSSLYSSDILNAYRLSSFQFGTFWMNNLNRYYGCSIRPVKVYDAEIEYLENSGTTYIDTGIIPDSETGIYVKSSSGYSSVYQTEDVYIVGLRDDAGDTRWAVGHNKNGYYYGYGTFNSSSYVPTDADSECKLNYLNDKRWVVNNTEKSTLPSTMSFTAVHNIRLFGSAGYDNTSSAYYRSCKGKIYFVKISQGSNVIMDLIPVRKGGVGYMYDKISGTLYGKSGDGELILGPDKT